MIECQEIIHKFIVHTTLFNFYQLAGTHSYLAEVDIGFLVESSHGESMLAGG